MAACRTLACTAIALYLIGGAATAHSASSPDAALGQLIAGARAEAAVPGSCTQPQTDRLVQIFCRQQIRVAVRDRYPLFATLEAGVPRGYDADVARALATRLGVSIVFVQVDAASRVAVLARDQADLTIATMGRTTERDREVRFIRPHYYQSETIVVGPLAMRIAGWGDIAGKIVCVTVGSGANAEIVSHHGRLMLFDDPAALIGGLRNGTCPLAAQDDSFFASYFIDPDFASRFATKFGFDPMPWGMAVAREDSGRFAVALDLMSQIFHRDGVFLKLALDNRIATTFLQQQRGIWSRADCNLDSGRTDPACVLPPLTIHVQPTGFAPSVKALENWIAGVTGIPIALPMFEWAPAWALFKIGLVNSLFIVAGALVATLGFAVALGATLESKRIILRLSAQAIVVTMQSSPILLTLVIAAALAQTFLPYSGAMASCAAIVALGLTNGSNAGQAIAEAIATLRAERGPGDDGSGLFGAALNRASTQIVSFLVNAAKGAPAASFIGAPELLNALTDVTSFSASGRSVTYTLVLVFYVAVIALVIALCHRLEAYWVRRHAFA